jgi:hypothetical protein
MNRFLAADGTGKFQIQRASKGSYIQSDPVQAANTPELAITPAEQYIETGKIWFDLFGISKPLTQPLTSQLAFEGVRRMKGNPPAQPGYANTPKSYTYEVSASLTAVAPAAPISTFTKIVDYDFELHQIIILKQTAGTAANLLVDSEAGAILFTALTSGVGGNSISIAIVAGIGALPTISVVGNAITFTQTASNNGTQQQFVDLVTSTPAAAALVSASGLNNPSGAMPLFPVQNLSGGSGSDGALSPLTSPVCAMLIYDQNRVTISNIPIMDIFYDGGPDSIYQNGAMVPPLFYGKDSVLQIDFYSEVTDPADLPVEVVVYLVGKKLYPCA